MKRMTCTEAKRIDMVDYLQFLGYHPSKITRDDHWYLSPLRDEATPSFKVNRKLGAWYDHGIGIGGDIVDFGVQYHRCGISDFLELLASQKRLFSFHRLIHPDAAGTIAPLAAGERKIASGAGIHVGEVRPLGNKALLGYLEERGISPEIAKRYCHEVDFTLYRKMHTAIGFRNDGGGYELRNRDFKGSSSPKGITHLGNGTDDLAVFEGFTDFLSFHELNKKLSAPLSDCLVLNSLAFLEASRPVMERYRQVHLILDRDEAGIRSTTKAIGWDGERYRDSSESYRNHKDLNEYLKSLSRNSKHEQRPSMKDIPKKRRGLGM